VRFIRARKNVFFFKKNCDKHIAEFFMVIIKVVLVVAIYCCSSIQINREHRFGFGDRRLARRRQVCGRRLLRRFEQRRARARIERDRDRRFDALVEGGQPLFDARLFATRAPIDLERFVFFCFVLFWFLLLLFFYFFLKKNN
jgi:hypothetical protein